MNPDENFADKWQVHPEKERNFRRWLNRIREDILSAFNLTGINNVSNRLKPAFGEQAINEAMKSVGKEFRTKRETGLLNMAAGTGLLGNSGSIQVRNHTFYGS